MLEKINFSWRQKIHFCYTWDNVSQRVLCPLCIKFLRILKSIRTAIEAKLNYWKSWQYFSDLHRFPEKYPEVFKRYILFEIFLVWFESIIWHIILISRFKIMYYIVCVLFNFYQCLLKKKIDFKINIWLSLFRHL